MDEMDMMDRFVHDVHLVHTVHSNYSIAVNGKYGCKTSGMVIVPSAR
jgi:hypothetical protein